MPSRFPKVRSLIFFLASASALSASSLVLPHGSEVTFSVEPHPFTDPLNMQGLLAGCPTECSAAYSYRWTYTAAAGEPQTAEITASAYGRALPGELAVSGSTTLRRYPPNTYQRPSTVAVAGFPLQVIASFFDSWTIDALLLTGTPGELELTFDVSGVRSGTLWLEDQALPFETGAFLVVVAAFPTWNHHPLKDGASRVTSVVPFVYGTPFRIEAILTGLAEVFDDLGEIVSSYDLEASFDFANTVRLTGMNVTDQTGNLVKGARLTTASGAVYRAWPEPEPIPEPTSVLTVLTGLAAVAGGRIWRRSENNWQ